MSSHSAHGRSSTSVGVARAPQAIRRRSYLSGYLTWLRGVDLLVVGTAVASAHVLRFGLEEESLTGDSSGGLDYWMLSSVLVLAWIALLHAHGAYAGRYSGHGVQEYRQVFTASMWVFSVLALISFSLKLEVARGYVLIAFPVGTLLLLGGRWVSRRWLVKHRRAGRLVDHVLLVGDDAAVRDLVVALHREPAAGYRVIGACVNDASADHVGEVPVLGRALDAVGVARAMDVDVVAVSSSAVLGPQGLRRIGWGLEGSDIELVVAPGLMDVAGPRVKTRPVQGLPLIHVEAPVFDGAPLIVKNFIDRAGAAVGLLLLLPVLAVIAVLIRAEDAGPVFFRQERVGRDGKTFPMVKFRSMAIDAEARLAELAAHHDGSGPLFKLRHDPRVTRTGAVLRRFSLDELPQLLNVARGEMSLVGPRPPLVTEVDAYDSDVHRRLLVKPGMTGMWQISGRSDLSWEESVRLDLYYVENWSPVLDLMIMWRTVRVVTQPGRAGAY